MAKDAENLVLIVNPRAGAGRAARRLPELIAALERHGARVDARSTQAPGHATELVREALQEGAPGVAVVGGDGTLSEALNGFFTRDGAPVSEGAWLGPLPCGTGGDFRKTVEIPNEVEAMAARLMSAAPRRFDVGWLEYADHEGRPAARAFLNVASFGLGGSVDRIVNESPKWMGGRLAFFLGTLRAMAGYRNRRVRVTVDDQPPREAGVLNLAVANGQFFGGGMHIAPEARVDDGLFDVVGIEREGLVGNLTLARHLYGGTLLGQPGVSFARGARVVAEPLGDVPVLLDVDGEAPGALPATFTLRPRAVRLR